MKYSQERRRVPTAFCVLVGLLFLASHASAELYSWGYSDNGVHGYGYTEDSVDFELFPRNPLGLTAKKISVGGIGYQWRPYPTFGRSDGSFALFLHENGTAYGWGNNLFGMLGLGESSGEFAEDLTRVNISQRVQDISAGVAHSLFLLEDGTVLAAGSNADGVLGLPNTNTNFLTNLMSRNPIQIPLPGPATQICASYYRSFFVIAGEVWAMGLNPGGILGSGSNARSEITPQKVLNLDDNVVSLSCSTTHALALLNNGSVAAWGRLEADREIFSYSGITHAPLPILINLTATNNDPVVQVAAAEGRSILRTQSGKVYLFPDANNFALRAATAAGLPATPAAVNVFAGGSVVGVILANNRTYHRFGSFLSQGTGAGCNPENTYCPSIFEAGVVPFVHVAPSSTWTAALHVNGSIYYAGKLRWAFQKTPRIADRWHRPGSITYGKVLTFIGDNIFGPFAVSGDGYLYQIGSTVNSQPPSDPEFTFQPISLDPIAILPTPLPPNELPDGRYFWYYATGSADWSAGGYLQRDGNLKIWCQAGGNCPISSSTVPGFVNDVPITVSLGQPVLHAHGRSSEHSLVAFQLQNGSVGVFGTPLEDYGGPLLTSSPSSPIWVNMSGTPAVPLRKLLWTGGGLSGGLAFLFEDDTLWWMLEPRNVGQNVGFPSATARRVPGFFKDAYGDSLSDGLSGLDRNTNTVLWFEGNLDSRNWGQGDFVQVDIQSSGYSALGLDSTGTAYYFSHVNGNEVDRDRYEFFFSWCDGAFPPVSGSPNWPSAEIARDPTPIDPQYFQGKKIKQLQLMGRRAGAFALTEFYPELDAFPPQSVTESTNSFILSLTGRYLRPNNGNISNAQFVTSAPNLACSVDATLTYTSATVSCIRNDTNALRGTIYGYFVRDGVAAKTQSIIALVPNAPEAAAPQTTGSPPQASGSPPQASTSAPTASTSPSATVQGPTASATPPVSQSAPNQAVSLSTSFIFNSSRDLDAAALDAAQRVLCEVATNITARTGITCTVRAVGSATKRAVGLHNATLTSADATTAAAVSANIAAIQSAFIAGITPPMAPTNPVTPPQTLPSGPTTTLTPSSSSANGGGSNGLGIGVGVGVAIFVAIVVIVAIILYRRKQAQGKKKGSSAEEMRTAPANSEIYSQPNVVANDSSSSTSLSSSAKNAKKPKKPKKKVSESSSSDSDSDSGKTSAASAPDGLYGALPASDAQLNHNKTLDHSNIPFKELDIGKSVGKGSFGIVYKGTWRGATVAIKECAITDPTTMKEFLAEAELMLEMKHHPNIVQVLGISFQGGKSYIVMEYLPKSLDKIVFDPAKRAALSDADLVRYATDIAKGMNHISYEKIVHRDLAVRNILIGKDKKAKISDFGLSRQLLGDAEGQTQTNFGPLAWMAPEAIRQKFSEKSDVWSYGIVLWEIIAGSMPHRNVDRLELPLMIRDRGFHPDIPENSPAILRRIMEACWKFDPAERPTFNDILKMLKEKDNSGSGSDSDSSD